MTQYLRKLRNSLTQKSPGIAEPECKVHHHTDHQYLIIKETMRVWTRSKNYLRSFINSLLDPEIDLDHLPQIINLFTIRISIISLLYNSKLTEMAKFQT